MRKLVICLLAALVGGCAAAAHQRPAAVEISNYNGAAGRGLEMKFDGRALSVTSTSDYRGQPDKVIWARTLTAAERAFLAERIDKIPLATLRDHYEDASIWDGLQLHFRIRQRTGTERTLGVANVFVEELAVVCESLNVLLPVNYRIPYREWNAEKEREERAIREDDSAPDR